MGNGGYGQFITPCLCCSSSLRGRTPHTLPLLQGGLPTGSQPPSGIHLLRRGVPSTGYRWIPAPPWTSMGCRRITYLTMIFITSCKGRLTAPTFRAPPPPPPSSLTLVSAELFLSHRLTPLSTLPFHHRGFFSSLSSLCYPSGTTTVANWLGLGQRRVRLRAGWHWLYQTWGKLLAASHRRYHYSPAATKTLPRKPITAIYTGRGEGSQERKS